MADYYTFEPDYTTEGRHYAHQLINWHSIIAGALVAIAVGFVLNVLGLAVGASAFNPFEINSQDEAISIGGGLYVIFAQYVAFMLGGYVASRGARYPDHFGGALVGITFMQRYGWKVGQRIHLQTNVVREDGSSNWAFDIVGVVETKDPAIRAERSDWMTVNYDYFDAARYDRKGRILQFFVKVSDLKDPDANKKLRIVVTEETVRYAGSNKIRLHHNVVRAFPGGVQGLELKEAASRHKASVNLGELHRGP